MIKLEETPTSLSILDDENDERLFHIARDDSGKIETDGQAFNLTRYDAGLLYSGLRNRMWSIHPELKVWDIDDRMSDIEFTQDQLKRRLKATVDRIVDTTIIDLCKSVDGKYTTTRHYNTIAPAQDSIEFLLTNGHRVPLVMWLRSRMNEQADDQVEIKPGQILSAVNDGLTKPEWRRLITFPDEIVEVANIETVQSLAKMLVELPKLPDQPSIHYVHDSVFPRSDAHFDELKRRTFGLPDEHPAVVNGEHQNLLKQVSRQILTERLKPEGLELVYIKQELSQIWDFIRANEILPLHLSRWTYIGSQNRAYQWHQDQFYEAARLKAKDAPDIQWESAIGAWIDEETNWNVVALNSAADLAFEGAAMKHCVGGYYTQCKGGGDRIFSVRDTREKRRGTLQLSYQFDQEVGRERWKVRQLRGQKNVDVSDVCRAVARRFAEVYSQRQGYKHRQVYG